MRVRALTFLSLLWLILLGSGAVEYIHNLQHAREDAAVQEAFAKAGMPVPDIPDHDDSNCDIHAQLHFPLLPIAWVPLLIGLGLLVAFLTLLAPRLVSQRVPARIDCRGPPAGLLFHLVSI
jgi:hypothetical protein